MNEGMTDRRKDRQKENQPTPNMRGREKKKKGRINPGDEKGGRLEHGGDMS